MAVFDSLELETPVDDLKFLDLLANETTKSVDAALEVGTWAGRTALILANHFSKVYCVDHWEGNPHDCLGPIADRLNADDQYHAFRAFCRNMGPRFLFRSVFPCVGSSAMWASVWNRPLDLVFIDACHTYESVRSDILAWRPHVRPGGILCGHDYHRLMFPGVCQAVDELIPVPELRVDGATLWWTKM